MEPTAGHSELLLAPLLVKAYLLGVPAAAIALHLAISLIAPGDAGTMSTLGDGLILLVIVFMVGTVGLVVFPLAALVSWPLRDLVRTDPLLAALTAAGVGIGLGLLLTRIAFQIGPDDFWSGAVVGCVFGLVWFAVVRAAAKADA